MGALISAGVIACATTTGSSGREAGSALIGQAAGARLCEAIWADLDDWRRHGSAIARVKFNGTVHIWALRNGAINISLARHRDAIDAVTRDQCPTAREQTKQIIDTVDLASGLVGF
ncbi:hypothetical protein [Nocardia sp. A7]|uniref:hypothetical protein n=1 Tax=Nocardia sp. A7 TaxID=2789274 RepID=UPI0039785743